MQPTQRSTDEAHVYCASRCSSVITCFYFMVKCLSVGNFSITTARLFAPNYVAEINKKFGNLRSVREQNVKSMRHDT